MNSKIFFQKGLVGLCLLFASLLLRGQCPTSGTIATFNFVGTAATSGSAGGGTGTVQTWTVPVGVTSIVITARGARGGSNADFNGGRGAQVIGTFVVTPGETLHMLVGGEGGSVPFARAGGGGGGSFVSIGPLATGTLLLVASGGGGASRNAGGIGLSNTGSTGAGGSGFTGGGGAGFTGNGADGNFNTACGQGGTAIIAGGVGGSDSCNNSGGGGYGGGGSGGRDGTFNGGGGGGGYNGGNGGGLAGGSGGRSRNTGTSTSNSSGINDGNGSVEICYNTAALPIKLTAWDAKKITNRSVLLTWQTTVEENNHYFSIERSTNGLDAWYEIARVEGAGDHVGSLNYHIIDEDPLTGVSYYRLKQVDLDATFSYSNLKAIRIDAKEPVGLSVYPNPTQNIVTIELENAFAIDEIQVFNLLGKKVQMPILNQGATRVRMDCSNLENGVYLISVNHKTTTFVKY